MYIAQYLMYPYYRSSGRQHFAKRVIRGCHKFYRLKQILSRRKDCRCSNEAERVMSRDIFREGVRCRPQKGTYIEAMKSVTRSGPQCRGTPCLHQRYLRLRGTESQGKTTTQPNNTLATKSPMSGSDRTSQSEVGFRNV